MLPYTVVTYLRGSPEGKSSFRTTLSLETLVPDWWGKFRTFRTGEVKSHWGLTQAPDWFRTIRTGGTDANAMAPSKPHLEGVVCTGEHSILLRTGIN